MPSSSDNHFTGKNGKAVVNGVDMNVIKWDVNPEAQRVEVTGTRHAGHTGVIAGNRGSTFTMTMKFDAAANPLDNPPNCKAGQRITNVRLYLDGTSSPYWSYPFAVVFKTPMSSAPNEATEISVECEADGAFYEPTGNFVPST